jgi:hypothetical protein
MLWCIGFFVTARAMADDFPVLVDTFDRPDSLYHGDGWESLNPGYWKVQEGALRRRFHNVGERARPTGYPWHWDSVFGQAMPIAYDPSLPFGMVWRRDWKLQGAYAVKAEFTLHSLPPRPAVPAHWKQHQQGYAVMGLCFAGQCLFESWYGAGKPEDAACLALWRDDGTFGLYTHSSDAPALLEDGAVKPAPLLQPGDTVSIGVAVRPSEANPEEAVVTATLRTARGEDTVIALDHAVRKTTFGGHFGVVARGLLDFSVDDVRLDPGGNQPSDMPTNELHVCYPLGDTLCQENGRWVCRFVALFRNPGEKAEIRIADAELPAQGWGAVPVAGSAPIVNNDFRRNTAIVDVALPCNPRERTLYYTVWKDGVDVTDDLRPGPLGRKQYMGRLPRLAAPYRICGLGCHIMIGSPAIPNRAPFQENWIHPQPTPEAFQHLDAYGFQVLLWDDDIWYLEHVVFPPSTDDAYKIITLTIANPTTRWQMMRHWNVLNPGDHDYGMDDTKGPEQFALRQYGDLGQDPDYMRRNFQIVQHLDLGIENPSGTDNPKLWRRWKMPDRDLSLLVLDARSWRTSQDTYLWRNEGWGHRPDLLDRTNPTRTLLGEEQFAWLTEMIRTDSSPLICVTGINALHTVWAGQQVNATTGLRWNQRDRLTADFAGWVKPGADRVINLLSSRSGVISVGGDVHAAVMLRNTEHRLYECSFGPLSGQSSRDVKEGFAPDMTDYDERPVHVYALYHSAFESPDLKKRTGPWSWNFLEMEFDPAAEDPEFSFKVRNLADGPTDTPRGGGFVEDAASNTGDPATCSLPPLRTLPNADVLLTDGDGRPTRGTRSLPDGRVPLRGISGVRPGETVLMQGYDGTRADLQVFTAEPPS